MNREINKNSSHTEFMVEFFYYKINDECLSYAEIIQKESPKSKIVDY